MLILADSGILLRFLERTDPQHAAVRVIHASPLLDTLRYRRWRPLDEDSL
jgi:hypothetical protein